MKDCLERLIYFWISVQSQTFFVFHEDRRPLGPGAGRHCTSHMASPLSGQSPCCCAKPQNSLCGLTDILSSCAATPAACILMVALGKCINKHKGKRQKESCSLGDFFSTENKTKILVAHLAWYFAPIQERCNISRLHVYLKCWQLLLPK